MAQAHETYDFVIVGSGAASVCAALVMKAAGHSALIVEKEKVFGGSTALSGGVLWIPNNPVQQAAGVRDSLEDARAYLDACAGPESKGSSRARRDAFLAAGPKAIAFMLKQGLKLTHAPGYACYHETDYPGGCAGGRAIVPEIFDLKALGPHQNEIDFSPEFPPMTMGECSWLTLYGANWKSRRTMARVGARMAQNRLFGRKLVGIGRSLQGRMLQLALKNRIAYWLGSPVTGLVKEGDRVTGVTVLRGGEPVTVKARLGVLINSGGFAHNKAMREAYSPKPSETEWTVANPGDTGEVLQMAMQAGADTENMDLFWWVPGVFPPEGGTHVYVYEHARPHAIVVDQSGERYVNEATSYVHIGLTMYRRNKTVPAIPSWMIIDSRHRDRYTFGPAMPRQTPKAWLESGFMKKADTLEDLAGLCGLPADKLKATVERFNGFAREGVDHDFHRGRSGYARYLGDPTHKPNPSLGTLEKGPFYAVQLWPRDVGTCGGLVTDEFARVLDKAGRPITGLYATGNVTSSVCGPSYPGAGASIGASFTFGYVAAVHASGQPAETALAAAPAAARDAPRSRAEPVG
jgi:3-oxosteroid 1-dehydrogenase